MTSIIEESAPARLPLHRHRGNGWEADPEAMRDDLTRHFRILQQAVDSHEGTAEKETGDGILATFATAWQAVSADGRRKDDLGFTGPRSSMAAPR